MASPSLAVLASSLYQPCPAGSICTITMIIPAKYALRTVLIIHLGQVCARLYRVCKGVSVGKSVYSRSQVRAMVTAGTCPSPRAHSLPFPRATPLCPSPRDLSPLSFSMCPLLSGTPTCPLVSAPPHAPTLLCRSPEFSALRHVPTLFCPSPRAHSSLPILTCSLFSAHSHVLTLLCPPPRAHSSLPIPTCQLFSAHPHVLTLLCPSPRTHSSLPIPTCSVFSAHPHVPTPPFSTWG